MPKIGILALQGDFAEHVAVLQRLGAEAQEVRLPQQLEEVEGLIIPGGESTTMARLMDLFALREPLVQHGQEGMPIWGTCAGMILIARHLSNDHLTPLGLMNIQISRNAFGRQVDSFEAELEVPVLGEQPFHAVFIRAPIVDQVGEEVEVLARLEDAAVVATRQRNLLATAFHPELTPDTRFHRYFLEMVKDSGARS